MNIEDVIEYLVLSGWQGLLVVIAVLVTAVLLACFVLLGLITAIGEGVQTSAADRYAAVREIEEEKRKRQRRRELISPEQKH